jgi:replicative DNA helicase
MTNKELKEKLNSLKTPAGLPRILTQAQAVMQNKEYIRKRASGELVFLETCYPRLNKAVMFEPNTMLTISALSGAGKSTLSKRISNSIHANLIKKGINAIGLSFNFEMLAQKTIGREVANMSKMSLTELYSSEHPLAASKMEQVFKQYHSQLFDYPLIYVEEPQDYKVIGETIYFYWKELCAKEDYFIVEIDHAVITKGRTGDTQKDKIDNLMEELNRIKKKIAYEGGNVFYIILSQMNRDIKSVERIQVPNMHYPQNSDLMASSSIEFFSDYIMFTHMPAKLNLKGYTDNNFPIRLIDGQDEIEFIYWHITKNREGIPDQVIPMLNNLKYFDFLEVDLKDFEDYCSEFQSKGKCTKK